MFNSVCGEQQPNPARHEAGMEKTGPQTSRDPQGNGTPQENHRRDNRGLHPERAEEGPKAGPPTAHSVGAPGCRGGKPAGSTGSRPSQGGTGLGPETKGPPPHNRGPARPVGPGPANRPPRVGRRPPEQSCPGARNHQRTGGILHRQGMVVGWGSTKMMSEAESKARPDT